MHFGCLHHERLTIEQEGFVTNGKVTGLHQQRKNK
jgi:hypothetical protein